MPAVSEWIVIEKDGTVRPCTEREARKIIESGNVNEEILLDIDCREIGDLHMKLYGNRKFARKGQENEYEFSHLLQNVQLYGKVVARLNRPVDGLTFHRQIQKWLNTPIEQLLTILPEYRQGEEEEEEEEEEDEEEEAEEEVCDDDTMDVVSIETHVRPPRKHFSTSSSSSSSSSYVKNAQGYIQVATCENANGTLTRGSYLSFLA